ncbi:MAG TPA: YHS domain-containing protein, partial [Gammaproteobacteria bacterium]
MVKDPVCKMSLEPGSAAAVADYAGRTFYFCSENCHAKFTADPAAYAGAQRRHPGRAPIVRASGFGILAVAALLLLYFGLVSLVSGWGFMLEQFAQFWPYLIALALGFGIQVGLYIYLRTAVHAMHGAGKIVA